MQIWKMTSLLCLAAGLAVVAEENTEFVGWMKATKTATDDLKKMEQKTGEQAVRRAEKIGSAYENMIAYWRQRNATDAVKLSEEGKAAALELATSAYSGNAEKAKASLEAVNNTCKSCHDAHREKIAEGKYRIK
jgi:cytochrome c556